jgi:23S rRNA (cytosine1962-C5)-methyltransferase
LVSLEDFEGCVIKGVHRLNRRLQIFDRTGPGVDHPVYSNCLESRYLKLLWARVV